MANLTQQIIRNLQSRIEIQKDFERAQSKYQVEMHRSYFDMADLNSRLIKENADLRRENKKISNK